MPNYRYHMSEYERRNNSAGNCSRTGGQRPQGYRAACAVPQNPCERGGNIREESCRDRKNQGEMSCAVSDKYDALAEMPLAMAYVPWQMWRNIYDAEKGFCQGTIFGELDKPFRGIGGVC